MCTVFYVLSRDFVANKLILIVLEVKKLLIKVNKTAKIVHLYG